MRTWLVVGMWISFSTPVWAARVALEKGTGKLIEYQSAARPGTVTQNAVASGYDPSQVEEREVNDAEWKAISDQWIRDPAVAENEKNKPVEIPLSDFGGIAGGLAGAAALIVVVQKKKEPS